MESRKNITGSACGLVGLVLTFTGVAGPYRPVVVAGLYGAGALIAPPERPALPDFPGSSAQLDEVRGDFEKLCASLTDLDLSVTAAARRRELTELLAARVSVSGPPWVRGSAGAAGTTGAVPHGAEEAARPARRCAGLFVTQGLTALVPPPAAGP